MLTLSCKRNSFQVNNISHTLSQLAVALRHRRLVCVHRTPFMQKDEFAGCRAFVEFENGSLLELVLADSCDLIEYPLKDLPQSGCDVLDEVDGIALRNLEVCGVCIAETTFSFGIVLKQPAPVVLCLDTEAAMKLDLYIHPLQSLLSDGASFIASDVSCSFI